MSDSRLFGTSIPEYKKTLIISIIDACFFSIMMGFGEAFIVPLALYHGYEGAEIGLITAVPILTGALLQAFSGSFISVLKSRKRMVLFFVAVQIVSFPLYVSSILFHWKSVIGFIIISTIYWGMGLALNPGWASWMADLTKDTKRERYFARRSQISNLSMLVSMVTAGLLMRYFSKHDNTETGFIVLFTIAFTARIISWFFLNAKSDVPATINNGITPGQFIEDGKTILRSPKSNLIYFVVLFNSAVFLAAPYFAPYMLNNLKFGYEQFIILQAVGVLAKVIFLPAWGKMSEHYGTRKPLILAVSLGTILPILWLFSDNYAYLLFVNLLTGFVWGGFELSAFNIMMTSYKGKMEISSWAWYNTLNGSAQVAASTLSGHFQTSGFLSIHQVFIISGLLRIVPIVIFAQSIKEISGFPKIHYYQLFFRILSERISLRPFHFNSDNK